jgi:beta-glucanase (GH16 family)
MIVKPSRRLFLQGAATLMAAPAILVRSARAQAENMRDPTEGRALAFDDGFSSLDTSVWEAGRKVNSSDVGFYGRSAFARIFGEGGFNPYSIVDDARCEDGKALQIGAKYFGRPMNVPNYYGNELREFQWISGNLQTAKRDGRINKGWRRGYFEARMLFPKHPLTWPAFWLLNGASILASQTSIEVDIVEHKGWEPTLYGSHMHEWGEPGQHHEGTGVPTPVDMTSGYFRYGVLIEGEQCTPYFERKAIMQLGTDRPATWTIRRSSQMDARGDVFFPLLTLALRTDVPFPEPLRPEDMLTAMRVDYFRVYV